MGGSRGPSQSPTSDGRPGQGCAALTQTSRRRRRLPNQTRPVDPGPLRPASEARARAPVATAAGDKGPRMGPAPLRPASEARVRALSSKAAPAVAPRAPPALVPGRRRAALTQAPHPSQGRQPGRPAQPKSGRVSPGPEVGRPLGTRVGFSPEYPEVQKLDSHQSTPRSKSWIFTKLFFYHIFFAHPSGLGRLARAPDVRLLH